MAAVVAPALQPVRARIATSETEPTVATILCLMGFLHE
jgi:hypothetical protein